MEPDSILATLRTCLIGGSRLTCDSSWADHGRPLPADFFGRIYYLRGGAGRVTHHGRVVQMEPGKLVAIPAFTPCTYRCLGSMDLSYVHFTATVLGSLEPFDCFGWNFEAGVRGIGSMNRTWDAMLAALRQDDKPGRALDADGFLRQLIACFAGTAQQAYSPRLRKVERLQPVFSYIDQRIATDIRLPDMARLVNLQPTYFSNHFTDVMGMTPIAYVTRQRIERSQGLLRRTNMKLQQIAEAVGFQDAFYFSRVFKKTTGMPPAEYRGRAPVEGRHVRGG